MKKRYFIPYVGFFLMPDSEAKWRANTPDKELSYSLFLDYHRAFLIGGLLLVFHLVS